MASVRLKPLARQTIVITGASSGIGLATARMAAQRGAAVVLVARNEGELNRIVEEIRGRGGRAEAVAADVGDREALERVAARAKEAFGGIDSWVNDAGVSIYGKLEDIPIEDHRKNFETNYWGVVYGSLIAAREMKLRGGAIVNLGSVLSDRTMIYQGPYCATKHAVKGFTDGLRMELEADGAPISVTLIKPSAIETTFQEHARNDLDSPGVRVPPPAYEPRLVARAILYACEHQKREIVIGFGGHAIALIGNLFPRTTDLVMEAIGRPVQVSDKRPRPDRADNLHEARAGGAEKSSTRPVAPVRSTSLLLEAQLNPVLTAAVAVGIGALALGAVAARGLGHGRVRTYDPRQVSFRALQRGAERVGRDVRRQVGRVF